jgi:hypothetical protein
MWINLFNRFKENLDDFFLFQKPILNDKILKNNKTKK